MLLSFLAVNHYQKYSISFVLVITVQHFSGDSTVIEINGRIIEKY